MREVSAFCILRVLDAIDRAANQPAEGGEEAHTDESYAEHRDLRDKHQQRFEKLRVEVARLRARSGESDPELLQKEDELSELDVGGAGYVPPKLRRHVDRQSELSELKVLAVSSRPLALPPSRPLALTPSRPLALPPSRPPVLPPSRPPALARAGR